MKKLNLWLLASLLVTAFALTSCSDDDDDNDASSASVVGKWSAYVKGDDPSSLLWRYDHNIVYELNDDKTFTIKCGWYWLTNEVQYAQEVTPEDPKIPDGFYIVEGTIFRFTGTYTNAKGKLVLTINKIAMYNRESNKYFNQEGGIGMAWIVKDTTTGSWSWDEQEVDEQAIEIPYSISGSQLTLGKPNTILTFYNHGMFTNTLTKQRK